jgi:glycine/D-amino acid oxidase-like deaminating enzyme
MDLRSPYPYWLLQHGVIRSYPSLQKDVNTDIAIIGAGISGALVAQEMINAGFNTIVLDRRHTGMGSTAASTALLQYEIDVPLHELIDKVGKKNAVRSYLLCRDAIYKMKSVCKEIKDAQVFDSRPSFQFASYKKDIRLLEKEYRLRKEVGIDLQWFGEKEIEQRFGFKKPAGLISKDGAEADAYRITHGLLKNGIKKGLQVYDNTEVISIRHNKKGVELITADKRKIRAKKLVIAAGYESQKYIPFKVQELHSTYAIASEPFGHKNFWYKNALIWETATPYLYVRTTSDNRIIVGGKDVPFTNPATRDELISAKAKALVKAFNSLFSAIPIKTDFKWTGNFASTKDGLPYIGTIKQRPHTWFALGYGGNGITFSVIAAEILRDVFTGRKNQDASIFSFDR